MEFHDLTLLSEVEIWGNDDEEQLEVIKKYGEVCAITDLAILTGAYVSDYHIEEDKSLKGRTGWQWTRSDDGDNDVRVVRSDGCRRYCYSYLRNGVVRPALQSSVIFDKISKSRVRGYNDTEEVEYGEYPQMAADASMQAILENEYTSGRIIKTGRSYTFDSKKFYDYDNGFEAVKYEEYEYERKKYIRVKANSDYDRDKFQLSNREYYVDGDYIWVEVSPVVWLVDTTKRMLISKKGLVSGIRYLGKDVPYKGDFSKTEMKEFLDKHMSKDLFQTIVLEKETSKKVILDNKATKTEKEIERLYTGESLIFPKDALRQIWDEAKKDEIILGETLKMNGIDINYPYLASLILMDYENVDPLAYDCLRRMIFHNSSVLKTINPFLKKYQYNLLITLLFNQEIKLKTHECAMISGHIQHIYVNAMDETTLKALKYWYYTHPSIIDKYDVGHTSSPEVDDLLINYEERAKLRNLTNMPF